MATPSYKRKTSRRGRVASAGRERVTALSVVLSGDEPPTEFRLFAAGEVETTKGTFTFDESSAASVMAEYAAHGIDLMIDYDHASLASVTLDPAQTGKAAGWFNLEVRGGELWAVNVRWTEAAAEALRAKEWRFMSPAFSTEDGRITSVLNVAITNLPATRRLEPLMAASAKGDGMSVEEFLKVCKALDIDMSGSLEDAMAKIKGESKEEEKKDEPKEEPKPADPEPTPLAAPEEDKPEEVMAASARLMRLTGKTSFVDSIDEVEIWRLKALKSDEVLAQVASERAVLELGRRKENAVALTKLGAETPHTTGLADGKLCKRLLDEPLDEQSSRVAALLLARGGKMPEAIKPPSSTPAGNASGGVDVTLDDGRVVTLSAREVRMLNDMGKSDPKDLKTYAARKAATTKKAG